jgi:hypothetical protein
MAQKLIDGYFSAAEIRQIFADRVKSGLACADVSHLRRAPRAALPFRAVNLPDTPGYDPGLQRHHLLPRQLLSRRCFGSLFEAIGREWAGFDDFRSNGMLLPASAAAALRIGLPLHRGPHRDYNAMVIERVGQVEAHWSSARLRAPRTAHGDAVARLQLLQRALRRRLLDPGRKRLALNRSDPLGQLVDFTKIDAMVDMLWPASDPWVEATDVIGDQAPIFTAARPLRAPHLAANLAWAC